MRGCWNPVGQCFFCWGGFLSGGVFFHSVSPPAHIYTHTHTHKTSCVYGLSRPRPFATLISLVRRDSAHPKRENSPSRKRERESLELLLVAESRVRRHQTFVAIRCAPFRVSKKHLQLLLDLSWETSVSECFSDNSNFVCVCVLWIFGYLF